MDAPNYITDDVKALIGRQSAATVACDAIEPGSIRRFTQAIMDGDPLYWDADYAATTKFGGVVAPPLFPVHMFQRAPGTPDPLDEAARNPDFDGAKGVTGLFALPPLPIPLKRLLNGGIEVECFRFGAPGERVTVVNRYADIYQKQGRSGPMVFVVVERRFANQDDEPLLFYRQTLIYM